MLLPLAQTTGKEQDELRGVCISQYRDPTKGMDWNPDNGHYERTRRFVELDNPMP